MSSSAFNALSLSSLQALAQALRDGSLSRTISYHPIAQIAGIHADSTHKTINELLNQGMTPRQIGLLVGAIVDTRKTNPDPSLVFELVLSGPSLPRIPTRQTAAVVRTLFSEAEQEVLVVGFVVYNGREIFAPLHERMLAFPELSVSLFFDVARREDGVSDQQLIDAYASDFSARHWPWPERPHIYFYPRSLIPSPTERGSLHAKCVIVDGQVALITSANYTEAAQQRNIETGILIRYKPMVERLRSYFLCLAETGQVHEVSLL